MRVKLNTDCLDFVSGQIVIAGNGSSHTGSGRSINVTENTKENINVTHNWMNMVWTQAVL